MKITPQAAEIDFEEARKLIIRDGFVQVQLFQPLEDDATGVWHSMNIPIDTAFERLWNGEPTRRSKEGR